MPEVGRTDADDGLATRAAGWVAASITTGVVGVTVAILAGEDPRFSPDRVLPAWAFAIAGVAIGTIVLAAWLASSIHPRTAFGLALLAVGLLGPVWAGFPWLSPAVRAAAVATGPLAVLGVTEMAAGWRREGRKRPSLVVGAIALGACLVHLAGYDPFRDPACFRTCLEVPPLAPILSTRATEAMSATLAFVAALAGLAVIVIPSRRVLPMSIALGSAIALVVLAAIQLGELMPGVSTSPIVSIVALALAAAVASGGVAIAAWRVRRTRAALAELTAGMAEPGHAIAGRGPSRRIAFAVPGEDRWVDAAGQTIPVSRDDGGLVVSDREGPILRIAGAKVDDVDALALTSISLLGLRNAQLEAAMRARLADVQASHRRVVAASDAERRRIERDLHDGAQQRLVSASIHVSLAQNRLAGPDAALIGAEASVRTALARLRRLAHGIFPAALTDDGLRAALEQLASEAEVPLILDVPEIDLDLETATAAYAVIAAAVARAAHEGATEVRVMAMPADGSLSLRIETTGGSGLEEEALTDVIDRVGAIGGSVRQEHGAVGPVLSAVLPCAS
jgi:signal transduction histidine kinase